MKKLTKEQVKDEEHNARRIIQNALNEVVEKFGYESIELGNASISKAGNIRFQLDIVIQGGLTREADRYEHWRSVMDLPPLGTKLTLKPAGPLHEIVGINTTATKLIVRLGDKEYLVPRATAVLLAKAQEV